MYMYVCLHPVPYNSDHEHLEAISCLLEAKDKMKQFTYCAHVGNFLSNTMQKEFLIIIIIIMFLGQNCPPSPPLSQHFAL